MFYVRDYIDLNKNKKNSTTGHYSGYCCNDEKSQYILFKQNS